MRILEEKVSTLLPFEQDTSQSICKPPLVCICMHTHICKYVLGVCSGNADFRGERVDTTPIWQRPKSAWRYARPSIYTYTGLIDPLIFYTWWRQQQPRVNPCVHCAPGPCVLTFLLALQAAATAPPTVVRLLAPLLPSPTPSTPSEG